MPPTTFEKYLPYAMALGVEHHWAQAFAGIVKDPPSGTSGRVEATRRIQSHLLLQFHAQHGQRHAPGVCVGAAREFHWIRIRRRRGRRWILRRRIWRWWRQRVLA